MTVYRLIDLFAGAGGMTLGFENSGHFRSVFAVEFNKSAAMTYSANFHQDNLIEAPLGAGQVDIIGDDVVFYGDINKVGQVGFQADFMIGGPPCQGFSPLGKISPRPEHLEMNQLWQQYMRILAQVRPLGFVIENVPQLLRSRERVAIEMMAQRLGYTVKHETLKALEYGVPQRRVRGFIVGLLGGVEPVFPTDRGERRSVADAISDLPPKPTTLEIRVLADRGERRRRQDLHIGRQPTQKSLERYQVVGPGENRFTLAEKRPDLTPRCWLEKKTGSTDVFGRLRWDEPAYTIRTEFFKPEKGCYLHPSEHRPITHREAARLQTFDDWFYFHGSKIDVARQIGNAVPAYLAQQIAEAIAPTLPLVQQRLAAGYEVPQVDFEATLQEVLLEAYRAKGFTDRPDELEPRETEEG